MEEKKEVEGERQVEQSNSRLLQEQSKDLRTH